MSVSSSPALSRRSWWRRGLALGAATATAVAMGAMSSPAEAATPWDRLASCEAGGNWDINTGNGYYGGLQFAKGSWDWAGGGQYATYPHQASRAEQIATGKRLLKMQSVSNAWPYCSNKLGLTTGELLGSSAGSSGGGSSSGSSSSRSDSSSSDSGSSASRGSSSSDSPSEQPSDSYRVRSGDTLARIASRLDVDGGWRALYRANDGAITNPNVIRVGQVLQVPGGSGGSGQASSGSTDTGSSNSSASGSYRVRSGDTLARIAAAQGVSGGWKALYRANDGRIADPNLIRVGQVLRLP